MADNIPWFKQVQSAPRGFRNGELQVIVGKTAQTVILDYESDDFKPWRETLRPHYAEYRDYGTGETYWKKFNRQPKMADMYTANNIIRKNEDGTYEYVKNRETGELRQLNEQEIMWMLLRAGA